MTSRRNAEKKQSKEKNKIKRRKKGQREECDKKKREMTKDTR